jgi:hypothetical protein
VKKYLLRRIGIGILFVVVFFSGIAVASSTGTIDPNNTGEFVTQFLNPNVVSDVDINFGKFADEPQYNITVSDTALDGYAWGSSVGYIVMNCADTTSGCSATNGNFKVANDGQGNLSGYAWGEGTGWINFGPFTDPNISTVKINATTGNFGGTSDDAGYAWSQDYGWIVFDCDNAATCVNTNWRPATTTPPGGGTGGGTSGGGSPTPPTGPVTPGVPPVLPVVPPNYIGLVASSVVCDTDAAMPHWGGPGQHATINATSAINFVNSSNGHCQFTAGQSFQWAVPGTGSSSVVYGPASNYTTFGPTDASGTTTTITPIVDAGAQQLPLREVLQTQYIPFTYPIYKNDNYPDTAEFYCQTDGVNYDNIDFIKTQTSQQIYYCDAFNTLATSTTKPTNPTPPTSPTSPTTPTSPTNPTNPTNPTQPIQPTVPPTSPGSPTNPTTPSGPGTTTPPSTGPSQPPTGTTPPPGDNPTQSPPDTILGTGLELPPAFVESLNGIIGSIIGIGKAAITAATVFHSPLNTVNKFSSTIGALATLLAALVTLLLANPYSLADLFLIPYRIWTFLLIFFGLKKKPHPWGTVYNSVTKEPLDPAYVVLMDMVGNEVATSITDIDGRYGFSIEPGTYTIVANKTNYVFPSVKMGGKSADELYHNLYYGEQIVITKEEEIIARDIPMDQLNFDWNEFAKVEQHRMAYYRKNDVLIARLSTFFFWLGFIIATITVVVSATTLNDIIFVVYILLLIIRHYSPQFKSKGEVVDHATKEPLSFAIIHILSTATGQEITHKVADRLGSYYCLLPNGTYNVAIDRKNPDASYTKITVPGTVTVKEGYLKKDFSV